MIYITGASGFLGSEIVRQLESVSDIPFRYTARMELAGMPEQPSIVIHCAAIVPTSRDDDVTGDYEVNTELVQQIINAQPKGIVFPSTMEREGGYALGKRAHEQMLLESSIPTVVLRFPGLFGIGKRRGVMFDLFSLVVNGGTLQMAKHDNFIVYPVNVAAALCIEAAQQLERKGDGVGFTLKPVTDKPLQSYVEWIRSLS
jgi:nucleoside-diphosphate-sugar epimerase